MNITSVNTNSWLCNKYVKSTCTPGEFEFVDNPCECETCKSLFDLCDIPPCSANSILVSPQVCNGGECGNQMRWMSFSEMVSELGIGDRYIGATFDDTAPGELEQKLRICPGNTSSGILKLVPKTASAGNKYLELCIDETKVKSSYKLSELTDGPRGLGKCSTININSKNIPASSLLVTEPGETSWDWKCPRQGFNAGIYMDGLFEAVFSTDQVNLVTGMYPLMEHLTWNHPNMSSNAGSYGNVIRVVNAGLYKIDAKLAYHANSYVNAIKLEVFNIGTGQSIGGDKDGIQANDNAYSVPWANGEESADGSSDGKFNAQMNNKINNLHVNLTAWIPDDTYLGIRCRVSTQIDTSPATTQNGRVLIGPVSVFSADDPKGSTYLYVTEVPMISY